MEGRLRLDAGTWGTMGVGLGYAIAAATCTDRLVVAVEGDSAFGFSGMEVETMSRQARHIVVFRGFRFRACSLADTSHHYEL